MKVDIRITIVLSIIILFCSMKLRLNSCQILDKVKSNKISQFSSKIKLGFKSIESVQINQKEYKELFENEMIETDTCYLFGKFKIDKERIGVYLHRSTYECDHRIELIELLIFENCKKIDSKTILFEDNHGFIYEISSKFNKDFNQLTIIEKMSSEYAMEPEAKIDTLFTTTYKIDLKSKNLDTIYRKSKFELLKSPPQK